MFYLDLFRSLHDHGVRYLLVGGLAMNLHGVPRMTMDVDLVLSLDMRNLDAFIGCARALGLRPLAPVPLEALRDPEQRHAWIEQKHMVAFALAAPGPGSVTVDVLLRHPLEMDVALGRGLVREVEGVPVRLAAVEDMISMKQAAGRRQDLDDIEHLRRLSRMESDEG